MIVFLNGQFVPGQQACISVFDRGFLYGDSLFEAVRISKGRPFLWREHWERFERGAKFIGISPPFSSDELLNFAHGLIQQNNLPECILRFQLSRGIGPRGFSPQSAKSPTFLMSTHPLEDRRPEKWKLSVSRFRTNPHDPLSGFKTANNLGQILARAEADAKSAHEALLLSPDGFVAEGTASNVFWVEGKTFCTPPVSLGILPGITRGLVLKLCDKSRMPVREYACAPESLKSANGVFLTLTSRGIVEVEQFEDTHLQSFPLIKALKDAYDNLLSAG